MSEILSIGEWRNNAELIADVAALGYLDDQVLDVTFGEGKFWTSWQPLMLTASDLYKDSFVAAAVAGLELYEAHQWDYRALPCEEAEYDVVVFDPPYKLNGTPALGEQDDRYGTNQRTSRAEVLDDIVAGARECYRVCGRRLLVKCMDQVEGGRKRWQTDLVTRAIEDLGGRKIDRFDIALAGRPQPGGRQQRTSRSKHSTLLVFEKPKEKR